MSKTMKNGKQNRLRNSVASNPLMGKSTIHDSDSKRLSKRKERVQNRQNLRKQTDGYNNGGKNEGHWQSGNLNVAFLPVAFLPSVVL